MRYFSLFSGIGGFELGIEQAYESLRHAHRSENRGGKTDTPGTEGQGLLPSKRKNHSSPKGSARASTANVIDERPLCIGYSEIDKYASSIYQYHFPTHHNYGDITKIDEKILPDFDLLVGGFPCQSFSVAGRRRGFEDTRGTLFFDIARILREKQPSLLLLENVKGLLSHDEGRTFITIIAALDELGYDVQWQVLNSKDFGVPQNRERVLIVGHLRGTSRPQVFPIGENDERSDWWKSPIQGEIQGYSKGGDNPNTDGKILENGENRSICISQRPRGFNKGGEHEIAPTIGSHSWDQNNHLKNGSMIRRLTPKECERLQGFPDDWTEYGIDNVKSHPPQMIKISDTQRYKCCGNAVTTKVIQAVIERIVSLQTNIPH